LPLAGLKVARWAFLKVTISSQRQTALWCQPAGVVAIGNYGDGVDGAPTGIDVPRWSLSQPIWGEPPSMDKSIKNLSSVTIVGLDIAKNVFQVHGVDGGGASVIAKAVRRGQLLSFFASLPQCCAFRWWWAGVSVDGERSFRLIVSRNFTRS
jgi:hypothetical protein